MLEKRAFEPEFLKKLDDLVLAVNRARTRRTGRRAVGRALGVGIEPENFREYAEGDDLRFLDWNALARLDELTMRTLRAERQVEVTILIDASASMGAPAQDDKFGLALLLGTALAYIAMSENDPVRIAAFRGCRGASEITATRFHRRRETFPELRPFIAGLRCAGEARLAAAVNELLSERRPPGVVVVLSDLLLTATDYGSAFDRLLAARHDVKVLHVMGRQEITGGYQPGAYRIRDAETGEVKEITLDAAMGARCRARAERHAVQVREACVRRGIYYGEAFGVSTADTIIVREFPRLGVMN